VTWFSNYPYIIEEKEDKWTILRMRNVLFLPFSCGPRKKDHSREEEEQWNPYCTCATYCSLLSVVAREEISTEDDEEQWNPYCTCAAYCSFLSMVAREEISTEEDEAQ